MVKYAFNLDLVPWNDCIKILRKSRKVRLNIFS